MRRIVLGLALIIALPVLLTTACATTAPATPTQPPAPGVQRGCEAAEELLGMFQAMDVTAMDQRGESLMFDIVRTGNDRLYRQSQRVSDAMFGYGTYPSSGNLRDNDIQIRTYLLTCESEGFDSSVDL